MRRLAIALTFVVANGTVSRAAPADDWRDCQRYIAWSVRAAACTRVLAAGGNDSHRLALAYAWRSVARSGIGDQDRAITDIAEAARLTPDPAWRAVFDAYGHGLRRDTKQALAAYGKAVALNPKLSRALTGRGWWLAQTGDHKAAFADFAEAIRADPKDPLPLINRGRLFSSRGEADQALVDFDAAIAIEPEAVLAFHHRGIAWRQKGENDRAITDQGQAIRLDVAFTPGYIERAQVWRNKREFTRALADAEAAVRISPQNAPAYNMRGNIRHETRQLDPAIADFGRAIGLSPDQPLYYFNRGSVLAAAKERDRAIADYRRVVDLQAPTAVDRQRKEVAVERLKKLEQAARSEATASAPRMHKRVALVIGNGRYVHAGTLANPSNDALAMAAALRRADFTHVVEVYDAGREAMAKALKEFGDAVEGAEWAVIFFAGHGMELNGTTYVLPVDAALKREAHVDDEAISLARLLAKVDDAGKLGLVILDSCRDNPLVGKMTRTAGATRSLMQGLAPIEPEGNVLVAYAARHGTVAEDGSGPHSPFTAALLKRMEERGLEVTFLFRKVRDDVRAATTKRQEPFVYGSLGSEPLYFKAPLAR